MELVYPQKEHVSDKEKRSANLWGEARLADKSVVVPEYLQDLGIRSLDFVKIDVDGKDFEILHTFDRALRDMEVLGVGVEVRYWGSPEDTDGAFHNVDRFLKERGFELFNLTIRRYSASALPSRFAQRAPGATVRGRVHQGDAMYARDLGSGLYDDFAKSLSAEKTLNLAVIFAIFDLPDCAAEIVEKFRSELGKRWNVDRMLDLLEAQSERRLFAPKGAYRRHVEKFEQHPREFLGTKNPCAGFVPGLREGYLKWRGRMQLLRLQREEE